MHIRAISVGYAVPRSDFEAVVHSAFQYAVNLMPAGQDRLLTLLASGEGDLPQGIRLDAANGLSFETLPVGTRAACRDGILSLEGCPLTIDLSVARRWESNLLALQPDMNDPAVMAAWEIAWQAVNERQLLRGSEIVARDLVGQSAVGGSVWIRQMVRSTRSMLDATLRYDLEVAGALESLIGLGPGLTPSGDDLVAGYLIGLRCTTKGETKRLRFLSAFGKALIRLLQRTNDISRTYLFHATRGQASSQLIDLAIAICTGAVSNRVLECTMAAMQAGHTSGMDAVTGLLFGLAAWDGSCLVGQYVATTNARSTIHFGCQLMSACSLRERVRASQHPAPALFQSEAF
jgi:hypothetical protein